MLSFGLTIKRIKLFFLPGILIIGIHSQITGQPVVNFSLPDSSCVGSTINIINLTTGGTTYYWNFCSGNPNSDPTGLNIGNPGNQLNVPTYLTLANDGTDCYSFISCQVAGIIRYYHGSSFSNNPIGWTTLGKFGVLGPSIEGIQVKKDNGNWYGFVNNNTTLVRLDFGASLTNTPTALDLGPFTGLVMLHGLIVIQEGSTWYGFATCSTGNKLVRFNFGSSLSNIPTLTDFGNLGMIIDPAPLCIIQDNSLWYGFLNQNSINLVRLDFGNSLANVPVPINLGNPGGYNSAGGLTIDRDCDLVSGYFTNYLTNGQLGKITFTGGVTGTVSGQILGNIGNLNKPHSFSEIFRENDSLFAYITNNGTNTLTRLTFPPCTNASVPSSTLFTPPPFSYNTPGTYNVRLLVDENLPDQVSLCKTIVIGPVLTVDLGPDRTICPGTTTTLDAGGGFTTYLWSNGATTQTTTVSAAGKYLVTVTKTGCTASDSLNVVFSPVPEVNLGNDTTVCLGQNVTFDAGICAGCTFQWKNLGSGSIVGTGQTYTTGLAGNYKVTVTNALSCHASDSIQLTTIPIPNLTNSPLSASICSGATTNIILTSDVPGATFSWFASGSSGFVTGYSNGSGSSINQLLTNTNTIAETVTYTITPSIGTCTGNTASYIVTVLPNSTVSVSITASNNNICSGDSVTFTATPANGGSNPSFQWKVNGINSGSNLSSYKYPPINGDVVTCSLSSSLSSCIASNPASSNSIIMSVSNNLPVSLTISSSANPICAGIPVTLTAIPINGGMTPIFQWNVNGLNVGPNSNVYTYIPTNNDVVNCNLNSSLSCITGNPASSNTINLTISSNPFVSFIPCFDTITTINAKPFRLKGGLPLGGVYSGNGVNSVTSVFDPASAGTGTKTITYSYTNAAMCSSVSHLSIHNFYVSNFICGDQLIDVRDSNSYPTLQIGGQCWLAANLNHGIQIPGTVDQRDNCTVEKYCYNDNPANCAIGGVLYQWDELVQYDLSVSNQGLCPPGWHIPTENDWNILFSNWTNSAMAGSPLKYSGYSGFNALLAGSSFFNKSWNFPGFATYFWSSTSYTSDKAWAHPINNVDPDVALYPASKANGFSVRCVKD